MKNLLITTFLSVSVLSVSASEKKPLEMFNGKNLEGWRGDDRFWSVEDGVITGQTSLENKTKKNTFLIWEGGTPADFILTLKYKLTKVSDKNYGNSGIQYRSKILDEKTFRVGGYQADIERGKNYNGILFEEAGRKILAKRGEKVRIDADDKLHPVPGAVSADAVQEKISADDWNHYTIIADGNRVQHIINGLVAVDVTDESPKAPTSGVIALQLHQGPPMKIQFKDLAIEIKEIVPTPSEP